MIIERKIVILPKIIKMKRICFVVDSIFSFGGVQRVTAVIAKGLAKDYDVTILTFDNPESMDTSLYELKNASINYCFFSYPSIKQYKKWICKIYSGLYCIIKPQGIFWSNLYSLSSFPSELRNALGMKLRNGQYDTIIGVHAPLAARLATLRPMLQNVRLFGWLHNSFEALFGDASLYIGAERKRHYIYQFGKLDLTIVLSNYDANKYIQYDQSFKPIVIYNPLTLKPGEKSSGNTKRFLAVGRFSHKHKGFDLLIEAYSIFTNHNKEWMLDIVGEGPEEEYYRSLISKYHLEKRIWLHPFTHNIQEYYSNAQIYILSSRWEGFGLVIVEAMAHGVPVISSDLPTSKEIMGDVGIYYKNGSIQDLAHSLEYATKIDWQRKSEEAINVASRFNVEHIIMQWKEILER